VNGSPGGTFFVNAKYKCPVLSKVEMSYPVILYPWAARAIRPAELQPGSASSPQRELSAGQLFGVSLSLLLSNPFEHRIEPLVLDHRALGDTRLLDVMHAVGELTTCTLDGHGSVLAFVDQCPGTTQAPVLLAVLDYIQVALVVNGKVVGDAPLLLQREDFIELLGRL